MNPKHFNTYVDGLQKTLQEKLFFIDKLGKAFFRDKIIIDFGCGDGSVLSYIAKNCDCFNSTFIAVDINRQMLMYAKENIVTPQSICFFEKLEDALPIIKTKANSTKVVFIANSVFHELNDEQTKVIEFIRKYVDTFIIRDMYVKMQTKAFADFERQSKEMASKLIANSNTKMLSQFVSKYGIRMNAMLHFLLKYTYVENWETEINEHYLSVLWKEIEKALPIHVYDKKYIQEWRKDRVKKDFDIDISECIESTHRLLILER